jgi:ABC-2 type transport system ATP-binding protein
MSALRFDEVCRAYTAGKNVLDGVSFEVERGQVVGLLGKNGAGKTTLIRMAMGMIEPQAGTVSVLGMDPRAKPVEVKRSVGYVPEERLLPPFLTVESTIALYRRLFPSWDVELARELTERFEIPLGAKIKTLSKGQARRVALLSAVAHRPRLLLLDEPASGLDPAARREFLETSIRLLNETETSILFSSHYMTDIERLADKIVMIHDGRVLIDNPLDELHEGFSLALLPRSDRLSRDRILELAHCLGVRERPGGYHAIMRLAPFEARVEVEHGLGVADARCQPIALEDMFVELVGGR